MFTGIIEHTGVVRKAISSDRNEGFWIESPLSRKLKIDQSVSHNGVCLTVEELDENMHRVTAIEETLEKTNLGNWAPGTIVNLERSIKLNERLDGHIVQGHVDTTASCVELISKGGSWEFSFQFDIKFAPLVIEKGSVCLNGISLTAFNVNTTGFTVAIIPYTMEHTNIKHLKKGEYVNVEFDLLGKYVNRIMKLGLK